MRDRIVCAVAIVFVVVCVFVTGFISGYVHVITNSKAYVIEHGDVLLLEVDGHEYQYEVSDYFYDRLRSACIH